MATVTQFWTDPKPSLWQKFGTTVDWTWGYGDDQFYWGFAVRPLQANCAVSVQAPLIAQSDNDMRQSTVITVTAGPSPSFIGPVNPGEGTLLCFTAIKVQTP
jgi:hypothetical protein